MAAESESLSRYRFHRFTNLKQFYLKTNSIPFFALKFVVMPQLSLFRWSHFFYNNYKLNNLNKGPRGAKRFFLTGESSVLDEAGGGTIPDGNEVWPTRCGKEHRFHLLRWRCCGSAIKKHSKHMKFHVFYQFFTKQKPKWRRKLHFVNSKNPMSNLVEICQKKYIDIKYVNMRFCCWAGWNIFFPEKVES